MVMGLDVDVDGQFLLQNPVDLPDGIRRVEDLPAHDELGGARFHRRLGRRDAPLIVRVLARRTNARDDELHPRVQLLQLPDLLGGADEAVNPGPLRDAGEREHLIHRRAAVDLAAGLLVDGGEHRDCQHLRGGALECLDSLLERLLAGGRVHGHCPGRAGAQALHGVPHRVGDVVALQVGHDRAVGRQPRQKAADAFEEQQVVDLEDAPGGGDCAYNRQDLFPALAVQRDHDRVVLLVHEASLSFMSLVWFSSPERLSFVIYLSNPERKVNRKIFVQKKTPTMFGNRKGIEGGDDSSCYQTLSGPSRVVFTRLYYLFFDFCQGERLSLPSFYFTASTILANIAS